MLSLVTAPATEPLSLEEAKLHLRVTTDDEDGLIQSLIQTAREYVEQFTGRALLTQTWDLKLNSFGCEQALRLPKAPLQSVTSITYIDTGGTTQTLATSRYVVAGAFDAMAGVASPWAQPGYVAPAYATIFPVTRPIPEAVTVRFVAGYGAQPEKVPAGILAAMKMMIGTWFGPGRQTVIADVRAAAIEIPDTVDILLWPFRVFA